MIKYYIQKPILVKAIQYTETNKNEVLYFLKDTKHYINGQHEIYLPEFNDTLKFGDFLVKNDTMFIILSEEEFNKNFEEYYTHEEKKK